MEKVKDLILEFYDILVEFNTNFIKNWETPLFQDLENLKHCVSSNMEFDDNKILYDISPIRVLIPETLSHTIPDNIEQIEIRISVRNIEIQKVEMNIKDPITKWGGFDIILEGFINDKSEVIASWHLDKREVSETYSFIEPEYHFSFGGQKMEEKLEISWNFGDTLLMRTPRLMHPPMGVILGIDFILNNYVDRDYCGDLLDKKEYKEIISEMKQILWKPYALAFAKNFYQNWSGTGNLTFDDDFCKAIMGE